MRLHFYRKNYSVAVWIQVTAALESYKNSVIIVDCHTSINSDRLTYILTPPLTPPDSNKATSAHHSLVVLTSTLPIL